MKDEGKKYRAVLLSAGRQGVKETRLEGDPLEGLTKLADAFKQAQGEE